MLITKIFTGDESKVADPVVPSSGRMVTVQPAEIDGILYNPGMGLADFHFGWGEPPGPSQYPRSTVAYFRWPWAALEPAEGQYNFSLVDGVIEEAKTKGETLAFRIVADFETGPPQWLLDKGVGSVKVQDGIFPDYNSRVFLNHHERLIKAFGERYAGSPHIDHVDIGSVGCWGEWNTACCQGVEALCNMYYPTHPNQITIIQWYFKYFPATPLVMLVGGPLKYAVSQGAGWRGDCFGDYGLVSQQFNHMEHVYRPVAEDPLIRNAWKRGPIQFEICGVMQDWYDRGYDIDLILKKGLEWHTSVLNAKSSPIPAAWRPRIDAFLKKLGYRIVLREMSHTTETIAGGSLHLRSQWENIGVAPFYRGWPLAYRLRSASDVVVATWRSTVDPRSWLPGVFHEVRDTVTVPKDIRTGTYSLDVAILTEDGRLAHVDLAIEGKRADRWYRVSQVTILD